MSTNYRIMVERAREWERTQARVKGLRSVVEHRFNLAKNYSMEAMKAPFVGELFGELQELLSALRELERLESAGGAA